MDEQLSALICSMIATERSGRLTPAAVALRDIKSEFATRGALGHGRLPVVLDQSAASEYERRATAYLDIAKRVVKETDTPWSQEVSRSTRELLAGELAADRQELLDQLRSIVGPQQQVRLNALESSRTRIRRVIEDELSILVIQQDRGRLPLRDLLSSPRYASVLGPWQKANSFLTTTDPDLANAAKEAVGSVEALARIVVADSKPTLGECIKRLRSSSVVS